MVITTVAGGRVQPAALQSNTHLLRYGGRSCAADWRQRHILLLDGGVLISGGPSEDGVPVITVCGSGGYFPPLMFPDVSIIVLSGGWDRAHAPFPSSICFIWF